MSLGVIAQSIVDRISELRGVGLTVRRSPNRRRQQGVVTGNGLLTVELDEVTGGAADQELAGTKQEAPQVWLLTGLLRNVREQDGVDNLFDYLTSKLFGWVPAGASGPITLVSFSQEPPVEDYLLVEMRLRVPFTLVADTGHSLLIDEVPEAQGAKLIESIFITTKISDRWGVNSDTTEVDC
ncbi:MAG: hypothetical protein AAGI45_13495 [Cyanobacteria bacterium P01_H01_bin.26]